MYNIHYVLLVVLSKILQNFKLDASLIIIFFLIFNNFDCNLPFFFMINAAYCCSKWALTKKFNNLIPICNMVSNNYFIVSFIIIEPIIMKIFFLFFTIFLIVTATTLLIFLNFININFWVFVISKIVNLIVIKYFTFLIVCKLIDVIS